MLQAAIAGLILLGIYKFIDTRSDYEIDWWMAFLFVFVPGFLIMLISIGIVALGLSLSLVLLCYSLYFIFPFMFLKLSLNYESAPAAKLSGWVPVVAVLAEVPFALLNSALNA